MSTRVLSRRDSAAELEAWGSDQKNFDSQVPAHRRTANPLYSVYDKPELAYAQYRYDSARHKMNIALIAIKMRRKKSNAIKMFRDDWLKEMQKDLQKIRGEVIYWHRVIIDIETQSLHDKIQSTD